MGTRDEKNPHGIKPIRKVHVRDYEELWDTIMNGQPLTTEQEGDVYDLPEPFRSQALEELGLPSERPEPTPESVTDKGKEDSG